MAGPLWPCQCVVTPWLNPASSTKPGGGGGGETRVRGWEWRRSGTRGGLPSFWQNYHLSRSRSPFSWGSQLSSL